MKLKIAIPLAVCSLLLALGGCSLPPETLSLEKYQQLQTGMTYQQVVAIIGEDGQEGMSAGNIVLYNWSTSSACAAPGGGVLSVSFVGNALSSKSQSGLPAKTAGRICSLS
jgi:hypothetical protein